MTDDGSERLPAVLVALSGAAAAFVGVMLLHVDGGISEHEEMRVFVLACILVPVAGIVFSAVVDAVKRRFMPSSSLFWPLLALANALLWVFLVLRVRAALPPAKTGAEIELAPVFRSLLVLWTATNVAVVSFVGFTNRLRWAQWLGDRLDRWVARALPFIVFAALLPFTMHSPPVPWKVLGVVAVAGLATAFHEELFALPRARRGRLAFDVLVLIAIYLVVVDPITSLTTQRLEHHNFYLGPVAALRAGKSMLVDVNCQYGVGVIYFLAALVRWGLMKPSIESFSFVICIFAFVEYAIFYATLRMTTRSAGLSALVSAVAILVTIFEQNGLLSEYPSTGGIRFLPGFLFVFCIALKARFPKHVARIVLLEALVIGATSIWSFEAFVYVFVAFIASLAYDAAHAKRGQIVATLRDRLGPVLVATAGWQLWLFGFTRVRAGAWPHWSYYFQFIGAYGLRQLGALPVEPWTPWLVIGGIYAVGLTALGYRRLVEETTTYRPELAVVFTMCGLGAAQFTYFVGRSHVNNLFHVCLPAFFVAGYVFIRAAKDVNGVSRAFRRAFVFVGYGALALCTLLAAPDAVVKFDHTKLASLARNTTPLEMDPSPRVKDGVELLYRHLHDSPRVVFFSAPDVEVAVFLYAQKASIYPVAYEPEDAIVGSAKDRIYTFDDRLAAGDIIVIDTGTHTRRTPSDPWTIANDVNDIDRRLWKQIEARFRFEAVEEKRTGLAALRLVAR